MARVRFNVQETSQVARGLQEASEGESAHPDHPPAAEQHQPASEQATAKKPQRGRKKPAQTRASAAPEAAAQSEAGDRTESQQPSNEGPFSRRVHVTLSEPQFRSLKRANADDDVDSTVRMRAMVELWMSDERMRAKVDKLAKQRNGQVIRHRPSTKNRD